MLTCNSERDNKIVSFLAPVLVGRIIIIIMITAIIVGHLMVGHITTFLLINQLHVDVTPNLLLQLISDEITISIGFIITYYVKQHISSLDTGCPKNYPSGNSRDQIHMIFRTSLDQQLVFLQLSGNGLPQILGSENTDNYEKVSKEGEQNYEQKHGSLANIG